MGYRDPVTSARTTALVHVWSTWAWLVGVPLLMAFAVLLILRGTWWVGSMMLTILGPASLIRGVQRRHPIVLSYAITFEPERDVLTIAESRLFGRRTEREVPRGDGRDVRVTQRGDRGRIFLVHQAGETELVEADYDTCLEMVEVVRRLIR